MKGSIDIDIDIKIVSETKSETTGSRLKAQKDSMKETQQTPTVVYTPPKQKAKKGEESARPFTPPAVD